MDASRDFLPQVLGQGLARNIEQAIGCADRDRQTIGEGKEPLHGPVHDSDNRRKPRRRLEPEMRVDDGAELRGGLQLGNETRRHDRRHGEDHVIIADRHLIVAEVEGHHLVVREAKRVQPMPEYDLRLVLAEKAQRRLDENLPKPIAGDERSAGFSPRGQCFADNGAGEDCACLLGLGVESGRARRS